MAKLTTYQVTEIAKDTWVINEAGMTAMFLLKGTERALLIDTGVGMTDLKKLISWLTPLPYDVVLTHGHQDHIGGAAQFEEVYIHEKDEDSLKPINYDSIADYVELWEIWELTMCMTVALRISGGYKRCQNVFL